jgi:hypothetical protein
MKSKSFFFAVLCGGIPGRAEKYKPKILDALDVLDVGPGRASISPIADARKSAMSGKKP